MTPYNFSYLQQNKVNVQSYVPPNVQGKAEGGPATTYRGAYELVGIASRGLKKCDGSKNEKGPSVFINAYRKSQIQIGFFSSELLHCRNWQEKKKATVHSEAFS